MLHVPSIAPHSVLYLCLALSDFHAISRCLLTFIDTFASNNLRVVTSLSFKYISPYHSILLTILPNSYILVENLSCVRFTDSSTQCVIGHRRRLPPHRPQHQESQYGLRSSIQELCRDGRYTVIQRSILSHALYVSRLERSGLRASLFTNLRLAADLQ